jgi:nucleotide-binding universal stress UspA family protein
MTERDNRAIVVGVDGTPGSKAALAFALEEGLARDATVEVVTTWLMGPALSDIATATTFEEEQQKAQQVQDEALAEVLEAFEEKPAISQLVLQNYGGHSLVEAARDAALLVVGSGRKNLLARALLGSVSEYCVQHSPVPVVVVPDPARVHAEPVSEEIVEVGPAAAD